MKDLKQKATGGWLNLNRWPLLALCIMALTGVSAQTVEPSVSVARYKGDRVCAISYTFDDGLAEHYTVAAPELEKRGFKGTFWICGYYTDFGRDTKLPRVTWSELQEMARRGHEISNHGWAHKSARRLTIEQIRLEIIKNDSAIAAHLGAKPVTYCYPYNYKTDTIVAMASEGRVATRTRQISIGSKSTPQRFAKWLDGLMANREWGVGMTHGIHTGYDAFKSPQLFWDHLDYVKGKQDSIWVGTFREVAAYIREREEIRLDITPRKDGWKVKPVLKLDKRLFAEPLTMVVEGVSSKQISVRQGRKQLPVYSNGGKQLFDFDPFGGKITIKIKE